MLFTKNMMFNLFKISFIICAHGYNPSTSNNPNDNSYSSPVYVPVFGNNYDNDFINNTVQNQGHQGTLKLIKLPFNLEYINDKETFLNQLDSIEYQVAEFLKNIKLIAKNCKSSNFMIGVQESNEIITLNDYLEQFKNLQQVFEIQFYNNDLLKINLIKTNLKKIVTFLTKEISKKKKLNK